MKLPTQRTKQTPKTIFTLISLRHAPLGCGLNEVESHARGSRVNTGVGHPNHLARSLRFGPRGLGAVAPHGPWASRPKPKASGTGSAWCGGSSSRFAEP